MRKYTRLSMFLLLISPWASAQVDSDYQNYIREIEARWNEYSRSKEFEEFQQQHDAAFQAFQRQEAEAYRRYVEEVERKWNEFIGSTRGRWVDYSEDKDVRSIINFEEPTAAETPQAPVEPPPQALKETQPPAVPPGQITVEAIVPAQLPDAVRVAKDQIAKQIQKLFSAANATKRNILVGQVKTSTGDTVTPQNVAEFVDTEVLPAAEVAPKPFISKDGIERIKVSAVLPMVPEHLRVRAGQYLPTVRKYSEQYHIDVPLALAVIETESDFNPMARSPVPAFGLMQLVPRTGGRDAYRYVFKKDISPAPSYLYVPENNVLLGVAYLHLIRDKYLYGIKHPQKQEYLAIAAYNGGIGRVIRRVLKTHNVRQMSPDEVYAALRREMPDETKAYLARVTSRKSNYVAWR